MCLFLRVAARELGVPGSPPPRIITQLCYGMRIFQKDHYLAFQMANRDRERRVEAPAEPGISGRSPTPSPWLGCCAQPKETRAGAPARRDRPGAPAKTLASRAPARHGTRLRRPAQANAAHPAITYSRRPPGPAPVQEITASRAQESRAESGPGLRSPRAKRRRGRARRQASAACRPGRRQTPVLPAPVEY
jgi:hypothetical protein